MTTKLLEKRKFHTDPDIVREEIRKPVSVEPDENSEEEEVDTVSQIAEGLVKNEVSVCDVLGKMCEVCCAMRSSGLLRSETYICYFRHGLNKT